MLAMDASDTNITFMHNDNVGTATKEILPDQPANTQGYDMYIFAKPADTTVYYRLVDINTGLEIVSSSVTTDLPINSTNMAVFALMSNGANTAVNSAQIGVNRIYIETDR